VSKEKSGYKKILRKLDVRRGSFVKPFLILIFNEYSQFPHMELRSQPNKKNVLLTYSFLRKKAELFYIIIRFYLSITGRCKKSPQSSLQTKRWRLL